MVLSDEINKEIKDKCEVKIETEGQKAWLKIIIQNKRKENEMMEQ